MGRDRTAPAKITRPLYKRYFPRKRLLKRLKKCDGPVIWISGPAGSGKTTLVSSYIDETKSKNIWYQVDEGDADIATFFYYMGLAGKKASPGRKASLPVLTPEYMKGVPAFTRRYFEALFNRLKLPHVVVLDNYHEVPEGSPFHDVIKNGLTVLTRGIRVIIISRSDPPPSFSRMLASGTMELLGWDDLRLDRSESKGIVELQAGRVSRELIKSIHEKAGGWAAGLVLLVKGTEQELLDFSLRGDNPETIFDYFAGELLPSVEGSTERFLTDTALLPRMTPAMAEKISGHKKADRLLAGMMRKNFFIERIASPEKTYQYHPLFREFLLSEGRKRYDDAERSGKQKQAAMILEAEGYIEDAADLFIEAGEWGDLSRLVIRHAPALIGQGRSHTIGDWLRAIPEDRLNGDPMLLYWLGIGIMPLDPAGARGVLERSFSLFSGRKDRNGSLRSWAAVVETFLYDWNDFTALDGWIAWFDENIGFSRRYRDPYLEAQVTLSVVTALMIRQPHHPDLPRWAVRALSVARRSEDKNFRIQVYSILMNYNVWKGETASSRLLMGEIQLLAKKPGTGPLTTLTWKLMEAGALLWALAEPGLALQQVNDSLAYARQEGIHAWDHMLFAIGVNCSVMLGDKELADEFIDRLNATLSPLRGHAYSHYYYLMAWRYFLGGEEKQAQVYAEHALAIARETGYLFPLILCELEMAHILFRVGDRTGGELHLSQALTLSVKTGSQIFLYMSLLTKAFFAMNNKKQADGLRSLHEALCIGREHGYLTPLWWWDASFFSFLCTRALEEGIEVEYVQNLIRRHNLEPHGLLPDIPDWPWRLKLHVMGTFEIVRDEQLLSPSGKGQKKPLEMLKALIALGGRDVEEQTISDLLWPDADGDQAHRSFETTLYRLRKLLDVDGALVLQSGRLSIDPKYCFVDLWALESLLTAMEGRSPDSERHDDDAERLELLDQLYSLYRGDLFGAGHSLYWTAGRRESLRVRFLTVLGEYGAALEEREQWSEAAKVYRRALDTDDLSELFHQRLMVCYIRLGRRAEAIGVYRHCTERLREGLGIGPSQDTIALHESLLE